MNKLTIAQQNERLRIQALLNQKKEAVEAAIEAYNEALVEAESFCSDIADRMADYQGERSDSWLESEKGDAYQTWMDEWTPDFSELDMPDMDHAETLADLPEAP
jgi:hypothetical protein